MNWNKVKDYVLARLNEAATWRGLVVIATALGAKIAPLHFEAIVSGGLLVAGFIGAALPDKRGAA